MSVGRTARYATPHRACEMRYRYFALADAARLEALVAARRAAGTDCAVARSLADADADTVCVFIAPPGRLAEMAESIGQAAERGARIETPTLDGEERRYCTPPAPQTAPRSAAEFCGLWYTELERHCAAWEPTGGRGALFLICGPTGVGKTCAVETTLVAALATRPCRVLSVCPADCPPPPTTGRVAEQSADATLGALVAADDALRQSAAGCLALAAAAAAEHCRRVSVGELPPTALLVVHLDDLQDVTDRRSADAVIAGLGRVAAVAAARPRNVALVGACDTWYSASPVVRALRTGRALPFDVRRCIVPPLALDSVVRRLHTCFPARSYAANAATAARADGNMWRAMREAAYGPTDEADRVDQRAACQRVQSLVRTAAGWRAAGRRRGALFAALEADADIDYGADAIAANYLALVPAPHSAPRTPREALIVEQSLDALAAAADLLSVADVYDEHRRSVHYAGRDGVDIDRQLTIALGIVGPCTALGVRPGGLAHALSADRLVFGDAGDRAARLAAEANSHLLADVRWQTMLLAARPTDGALVLSAAAEWHGAARTASTRAQVTIDDIERAAAIGAHGLEWTRRAGLTKEDAVRVVVYARRLADAPTAADVEREYAAAARARPAAFAPRIVAAGRTASQHKRPATRAPPAEPPARRRAAAAAAADPTQRRLEFPRLTI